MAQNLEPALERASPAQSARNPLYGAAYGLLVYTCERPPITKQILPERLVQISEILGVEFRTRCLRASHIPDNPPRYVDRRLRLQHSRSALVRTEWCIAFSPRRPQLAGCATRVCSTQNFRDCPAQPQVWNCTRHILEIRVDKAQAAGYQLRFRKLKRLQLVGSAIWFQALGIQKFAERKKFLNGK